MFVNSLLATASGIFFAIWYQSQFMWKGFKRALN
jgi:hypothetical protein